MRAGEEITIEPSELVAGGAALARIEGFPIFAANLYPGDVAVVQLSEVKKGYARADLVRLITPSPLRRAMPCPIADECGGCDWTALRLDAQLEAKRRILTESLRRIGKIREHPPIALHPSALNYRLRSRLHREGDAIGFYAMRSNRVVPLARECEVVGVETAMTFGATPHPASGHPLPAARGEGLPERPLAAAWGERRQVDEWVGPLPAARGDGLPERPLAAAWGERRQVGEWVGPLPAARGEGPRSGGEGPSIWEIDGRLITHGAMRIHGYSVTTDAFFQVNRHLLDTMLRLVRAHAERCQRREAAVDLYAGVGFFSVPLASLFRRVIAVEGSTVSIECAKRNVPRNVELVHAPVETYKIREADFLFLDPPRSGTRRPVIEAIAAKTREMICFLACDPVTFSRDASRLIASGWRLATLDLLDLFPNTHHVETLATFERAE